jgi:hypothetical protein
VRVCFMKETRIGGCAGGGGSAFSHQARAADCTHCNTSTPTINDTGHKRQGEPSRSEQLIAQKGARRYAPVPVLHDGVAGGTVQARWAPTGGL